MASKKKNAAKAASTEATLQIHKPKTAPAKPKKVRAADAAVKASATEDTKAAATSGGAAKPKKVSALDAAALVLQESGAAMNCQEMIAAMAAKGYWTSPGGKTPHSTLYSAL